MNLNGRALFNLLRINWLEDQTIEVKPWQVEDLRAVETSQLFDRLKTLGIALDQQSFLLYCENAESPEDLLDIVWLGEDDLEESDRIYLILFELWRRLLPDRIPLSIFCDEIDHLIDLYDSGGMEEEDVLQGALTTLEDILDDSSDAQGSPQEIFNELSSYCAHDLERFIYDYTSDQIEAGNETYASELIDAFYEYATDKKRFDFLRARLCLSIDVLEGNILFERLLDLLTEEPDLELQLAIAESLVHRGDVRLFMLAVRISLPLLEKEEQFQDILNMVADYYRCLDREDEEKSVKELLGARTAIHLHAPIDPSDFALVQFLNLLKVLPS